MASDAHQAETQRSNTSGTMHDGVETWDDLCICEPEPRWAAAEEELRREGLLGG